MRQRSDRFRGDDGSVIVEAALVLPFLALFIMGIVEFGFGFRQANIVERGASAAARVTSQQSNNRNADFEGIRTVASVLANIQRSTIRRVTIYQPDGSGNMSSACKALVPASTSTSALGSSTAGSRCNVYSNAQVQTTSPAAGFGGSPVSCAGNWDQNWCPPTQRTPGGSTTGGDAIGVFVEIQYTTLTKLQGSSLTIARQAVYIAEPVAVGS